MVFPATFKAYQYQQRGGPFDVVALNLAAPQPALEPNQVRVKIFSAAVNPVDLHIVDGTSGTPSPTPSPDSPANYGFDLAGTIVEVGNAVKNFVVGDEVYAMTTFEDTGAFAEYFAIDAELVAIKPKTLSFNEAAAIPLAALTSYQALVNYGQIKKGDRVLILGGSGGTGTFAVQIAKALGAFVITTTSFRNVELVQSLGADQVVDYTKAKWVDVVEEHSIDILYDCGAEPNSWATDAQQVLRPGGRFVTILVIKDRIESPIGATGTGMLVSSNGDDLTKLTQLVEAGKLSPVIDSVHPFEKLSDALKVQQSGRAKGKIVVEIVKSE